MLKCGPVGPWVEILQLLEERCGIEKKVRKLNHAAVLFYLYVFLRMSCGSLDKK